MSSVSRGIDRIEVTFDEPNLVANAGLLLVATLVGHLGLEALINKTVRLSGRVGGALPGRKVLDLGSRDDRWRIAHRPCRHPSLGSDREGPRPPGDGTVDAWHLSAVIHFRSYPTAGPGTGRIAQKSMVLWCRSRFRGSWYWMWIQRSVRSAASTKADPAMDTPRSSATTRSSPCASNRRSAPRTNEKRPGQHQPWCGAFRRARCPCVQLGQQDNS